MYFFFYFLFSLQLCYIHSSSLLQFLSHFVSDLFSFVIRAQPIVVICSILLFLQLAHCYSLQIWSSLIYFLTISKQTFLICFIFVATGFSFFVVACLSYCLQLVLVFFSYTLLFCNIGNLFFLMFVL
jgi:hypothetical protein